MESQYEDQMLDLLVSPAFCVRDGLVQSVNAAAQQRTVARGMHIDTLLLTGRQEYAAFTDGCLYLTLNISGSPCGASVTRIDGQDIFVLEQDADQSELQAMALAAQELRKPLSSVMLTADRLFPMLSNSGEPDAQAQIARINRGLFQMLRVISNMSDAARFSRHPAANLETRNVCAVFEELFSGAEALIQHAGIHLQFENLPGRIFCLLDAEMLERAVYNILSNAIKFTPRGGTIHARLTRRERMLYLTVQDSGSGVKRELQGNVFARYQRQPGVEDGRFGLGLGMVLIRAAASMHGGTVLMEQPENAGVRVTMTMELRQAQPGTLRSPLLHVDYGGERDHRLIELSDALPADAYYGEAIN